MYISTRYSQQCLLLFRHEHQLSRYLLTLLLHAPPYTIQEYYIICVSISRSRPFVRRFQRQKSTFTIYLQSFFFCWSVLILSFSRKIRTMNIDNVLVTVGMGRYQFAGCVLFGFMIMYSNVSPVTYVFTAGDLKYR